MAAPCSTPSSRPSAKKARQQARRAESLSGSIRQFLTPEVWKQARQAARAAGCRNDPRWPLQPLILTWATMTWCAGQTDAERFLTARTFYVRVHGPKRKRPERTSAGSTRPAPPAHHRLVGRRRGRAPPTRAHPGRPHGRLRLDRLRVRRHAPGVPAHPATGGRPRAGEQPGSAPCSGSRAGQPPDRGALVLAVRDAKAGERQHLLDLLEDLPLAPRRGSCWSRRRLRQLRMIRTLLGGDARPDPAVVAGTALQRCGVEVLTFREPVLY